MISPAVETARKIQQQIWESPIEKVFVIDTDGEVVFHKTGSRDAVPLTWEDMYNCFEDGIFLHNHPSHYGVGFSDSDIYSTISGNCLEARVVTKDRKVSGKRYLYILRRPKGGWPVLSQAMATMERMDRSVKNELQAKVDSDEITTDYATSSHNHTVLEAVAAVLKLDYRRLEF